VTARRRAGFRQALGFLTVLGGSSSPGPDALVWFPVVGAVIGVAVGGTWWAAAQLWPRPIAAALAVAADLVCTGMLHLDGLCDTADGLLPPMSPERRLAVMRAPDVGAFGVGVAALVLLLRWVTLAARAPSVLMVAGVWVASRTAMAVVVASVPYARAEGLASAFRGGRSTPAVIVGGSVLGLGLAAGWRPLVGPGAVLATASGAAAVVAFARHRVGGFTGDVLGAAGMVGETVGLLVAAARW